MITATSCGIGRSSRDACRRTAAWPLLAALGVTLAASAAAAAIQPNDDTPAGTAAAIELALSTLATLPPSNPSRPALDRARAACTTTAPPGTGCALAADRCGTALAALYDALGRDAGDALGRNLFRTVRRRVGDALSRLAWTRADETPEGCAALAPPGTHAARIEIGADGRSVAVRPLRPLRAGRRYRLLLEGLPPDVSVRWWTDPSATAEVEADLVAAYEATFPEHVDRFAEADVRALLKRIAEDGLAPPGIPGSVGIRGRLSRPLDGTEVARLRASFASTHGTPPVAPGTEFRTADPRAVLVAYRDAFAARACTGPAAGALALDRVAEPGFGDDAVAAVYRGRYPSAALDPSAELDVGATPGSSVARAEHGFVLALPVGFDAETTPLVLLEHGHGGNAQAMLKNNAIGLARRGLATVAVDLPAHGSRSDEPEIASPLEPVRLTRGLRRAAVDALGLVDAAIRCGLALPDGAGRYAPTELRFLGYSLGAAVGVLLRAVEPRIGTTVLITPPADLVDWQVIQVARVLGVTAYGACSGGSSHGAKCKGTCEPDGTCIADPQLVGFADLLSFAYGAAFAGAQPVSFAGERTGPASTAPLLMISAGVDMAVGPAAGPRLADVYGMTLDDLGGRRGRAARLLVWPSHGHDLLADLRVRRQAYDFLATRGRAVVPVTNGPPGAPLSAASVRP